MIIRKDGVPVTLKSRKSVPLTFFEHFLTIPLLLGPSHIKFSIFPGETWKNICTMVELLK